MNKELFYRFFEGSTSIEEEKRVRDWIEKSDENFQTFLYERKMYDALLLTAPSYLKKKKKKKTVKLQLRQISAVAAIAVLLIVSGFYLFNINSAEQFNTVLVPPGQRINIILTDNTNVWLNANSKFKYSTHFSRKNRTVYLDGEAYFEVTENNKKPFIVKTSQGDVRVTGTTFNVEAYSCHNSFNTSLFEGGVEIYKDGKMMASLKPNEKAVMLNNKLQIAKITNTDEYLWRNGLIAFSNKKLGEVFRAFEKNFDMKISIKAKHLPDCAYTGKFRQADGIDYALWVLRKDICFKYERDDETKTIIIF